jgi:hypothetical protein
MAYKKAGGEMAAFKKSLLKANNGRIVKNKMGPMTEMEAAQAAFASPQNDPALPPIPYANPTNSFLPEDNPFFKKRTDNMSPYYSKPPSIREEDKGDWNRKGGSVGRKK